MSTQEHIHSDVDLGEWGVSLEQLEQTETEQSTALEVSSLESEHNDSDEDKKLALMMFSGAAFGAMEEVISLFAGVDFRFSERAVNRVTEAAYPVLQKRDFSDLFGDYIEEATLFLTVVVLACLSMKQVKELKAEQAKQNTIKKGAEHEEK